MKEIKVISVCETDCDSTITKMVKGSNGHSKQVVCYHKVTNKGAKMYVEITTLPNGKKVSVTKHGFLK